MRMRSGRSVIYQAWGADRDALRDRPATRDEMGYEAAVPDKAASHRAPPAISFLYFISASG